MGSKLNDSFKYELGSDLYELVLELGGKLVSVEAIIRLNSPRQQKANFKLSFRDGRQYKARLYKSEENRRLVSTLAPLLGELPFSRIIASRGRATIEEWIPGIPLQAEAVTNEQARRAGELLGVLHTGISLPAELRTDIADADIPLQEINSYLATIIHYASEESRLCDEIALIAVQTRPAGFETGLIHADYCADNMVLTGEGRVVVVDNEGLRVGALDYDLARCWCRWPMAESQREAFCHGYQQYRSMENFMNNPQFWAIRALTQSLFVHLKHGRKNQPALDALYRLASAEKIHFWPTLPDSL